jgi:hypothetical protein
MFKSSSRQCEGAERALRPGDPMMAGKTQLAMPAAARRAVPAARRAPMTTSAAVANRSTHSLATIALDEGVPAIERIRQGLPSRARAPGAAVQAKAEPRPVPAEGQHDADAAPPRPNRTGLPDRLKAGVEGLSGHSLDDVRVTRHSARPSRIGALAFTQGADIHLGPGQERHLAHEAWHVVQQKQGRVRATMQLKGVGINDDDALEREAEVMGERATSFDGSHASPVTTLSLRASQASGQVAQRAIGFELEAPAWLCRNRKRKSLAKYHPISPGEGYELQADQTTDGKSDLEFVTKPFADKGELTSTIRAMAEDAEELEALWAQRGDKKWLMFRGGRLEWIPIAKDVEISCTQAHGKFKADFQITVGVPLERLPDLHKVFEGKGRRAKKPFKAVKKAAKDAAEDKGKEKGASSELLPPSKPGSLQGPLKGFVLLVIDVLLRSYEPPRPNDQPDFRLAKKTKTPFGKDLFSILPKNEIQLIFAELPEEDRKSLSYKKDRQRYMRRQWVDWFIKAAFSQYLEDLKSKKKMKKQLERWKSAPLVNFEFDNGLEVDVKRKDWLKNIPNQDLLAQKIAGLGEHKGQEGKMDILIEKDESDEDEGEKPSARAPIFELRQLTDYAFATPDQWLPHAEDAWDKYTEVLGPHMYEVPSKK